MLSLLALILPALGGESWRLALRYDRIGLMNAELWRVLSAHLVHLDFIHALLNAAGFAMIWALFARAWHWQAWLLIAASSIAVIGAGLWWWLPQLEWYVGASGLLHGLFAAGVIKQLRLKEPSAFWAAAILILKLIYEQKLGRLPLEPDWPVVTEAHGLGALGGAVAAILLLAFSKKI